MRDRRERRRELRRRLRLLRVAAEGRPALGRHRRRQALGDRDGGAAWTDLTAGLPAAAKGQWIAAHRGRAGTTTTVAYLAVSAYRTGNHAPLVYRTADLGRTWTTSPATSRRTSRPTSIREDPKNPDLLFAGHGIRPLRLARPRRDLVEARRPPDRPGRRHRRPPARPRPRRRHARPQPLRPRRRRRRSQELTPEVRGKAAPPLPAAPRRGATSSPAGRTRPARAPSAARTRRRGRSSPSGSRRRRASR